LAARDEATAARIHRSRGFPVRIATQSDGSRNGNGDGTGSAWRRVHVDDVGAVALESPAFARAVAEADLVCTSVGVGNVRGLATPLARGLAARAPDRPIDVWTVENDDCAPELETGVRSAVAATGLSLPTVGFAGAITNVTVAHGSWRKAVSRPEFVGDDFRRLLVDERRLVTGLPCLPGVAGTSDYIGRLREKLYVFNAGHAICAYLGWLRRHETVADASADPALRPVLAGAMLEARRALLAAYPTLGSDVHAPIVEAMARFADRRLADPVVRVARDPIRKLAPGDRLLGPAELIQRLTGSPPDYFALAVAGALLYRNDTDFQSRRLAAELADSGLMAVLESVCGLPPDHPFAEAVATRYWRFVITKRETILPPAHVGTGEIKRLRTLIAAILGSQ
jgi:mannitol-1-phosphate 5-dehydrogenase